jgi:hypothetical protein
MSEGNIIFGSINGGSGGGGNLPGVTVPLIDFTVGDGQVDTPANGSTVFEGVTKQGQNIVNKQLLVIRNGIELPYSTAVTANVIKRFNSGGVGGFYFDPASGISFQTGDQYDIYILGINNTIQI